MNKYTFTCSKRAFISPYFFHKTLFVFLFLATKSVMGQGVFGGKVAVMDAGSTTIWYNMNGESCDGAGTGNLSTASGITTLNAYLGDRYFMGGNVLTWGFGSSGNGAFLQWRVYTVGGSAPSWGSALNLPYNSAGVCSNGSNKKFEKVPVLNENSFQCTSTGSLRLDVLLNGYQSGTNYDVYTSGNYIPITVTALTAPTVGTVAPTASSATSIDLNWTRWNSKNVIILRKTSAITTAPTDGTAYTVGSTIDGATVIYNGSGTSTSDGSLTAGTRYYYAFYSVNNDYYSSAATASATAGTYYTIASTGTPTSTAQWTNNSDGTGAAPSAFTDAAYTFVIQSGHTYTMTANWTVAGTVNVQGTLYVSNTSTARTLSTGNLITSGTVYIDGSTAASTLTVTGDFTQLAGTMNLNSAAASTTTSTFNIGGNFSQSSGATITESGSNAGSIVFNSVGTQTYSQAGTISNAVRIVKNAAGTLSLSSNVTWPSNVTISSGSLDFGSTARTMTLGSASGIFNFSGSTVNMSGGNAAHKIVTNGSGSPTITFPTTWTHGTGDIFEYANSGTTNNINQNVTFQNLTITSGTIRVGTSSTAYTATVNGDLTINGGTLTITESSANHILTVNGNVAVNSGGTLNTCNYTSNTSTLNLYGNLSVNGTGAFNKTSGAATSTVNFLKSSGTQTVSLATSASYAHVWVVGNGSTTANTVQVNANWGLGASSSLSIESGSTLDIQNFTITGTSATFNAKTGSTVITQNTSGLSTTASTGAVQVSGSKTYATGANYTYNGSSAQVTGNGITGANSLNINNSAGVSLSGAVSVSGTLTFTSGLLTTTSSNLLTITNTSTSAISGAGTGKYVSGPLRWNLSNSNGTYVFAVGKGGNYYPFTLATTAASSPVITVEAFNSDAGGTNGATITSPSTTEYWSATLNSGTFTGSLSLTRPNSLTSDVIAQSSSQAGTYSSIGGTLSSPSINNSNSISSLGFFKFAQSAACTDPTTQATGLSFSSIGATGMTINWSGSGNGDGVIVVVKAGSTPTDPSDNTSYTANTTFGSGTDVGSSSFVVFNGSGSSVTVTGLTASTTYHVSVYSRNCTGSSIKINTTSPLSGSQITLAPDLAAHPVSFTAASTIGGQVDLSFTAASTISNAFGYIILQKTVSNPTGTPTDATSYSIGGTIGDGTVADIITDASQTSTTISGLNSSIAYYYSIIPFSYDGTNAGTYNYYTAPTIPTANATTPAAVTRYAVASGNWNATSTWSSSSGGASGASVPTGSDVVYTDGTHTVTVTAAASCGQLNFSGTGSAVSVNSGITLAVSGSVRASQSASQNIAGTITGSGTLTCASISVGLGSPTLTGNRTTAITSTISTLTSSGSLSLLARDHSGYRNNPIFTLSSGTLTVTQVSTSNQTSSCTSTFDMGGSSTGTLILTSTSPWSLSVNNTNTISLNGSGATVNYAATGAQTVRNTPYTNLTLSGSGNKTLAAFSISGTLSVEGSAVGITAAPTFGANSTLQYKNVGTRTTNAIEWPSSSGPANLIIDNSGSTVTMLTSAARTLSGNLTLTAGTLADNGNVLTVSGNIAGIGTHSSTGSGEILMNGSTRTISGATLGNLELSNAGGYSLSGSPTVTGVLNLANGTLAVGANTLTYSGSSITRTSGNIDASNASATLSFTNGTGFTLPASVFSGNVNNFTLNGAGGVTLGGATNVAGALTLTNGTLTTGANTLTYSGSSISRTNGNINVSNASGTVAFTNTSSLTLPSSLFSGTVSTFTVNGSGGVTLGGNTTMGALNLTSGTLTVGSTNTVTINSGGTVSRTSGALASSTGAGKFSFSGSGTVSGTVGFNDVDIAGAVNFGTAATVNGTLTINAGGWITPNAPLYGPNSLLKYNTGNPANNPYGRGFEWSTTSGAGYPNDVQISNNTSIDYPNSSGSFTTNIGLARDLIIDAGSSLYMDYGSGAASGKLFVGRSVNIAGDLSLGDAIGGDIYVGGDWTRTSGSFNANNRAVFFTGTTGNQTITNASGESFPFVLVDKASGDLVLNNNVTISGGLTLTNGLVDIGNNNVDLLSSTLAGGSPTSYVRTSGTGECRRNLAVGATVLFPVGRSTYNPVELVKSGTQHKFGVRVLDVVTANGQDNGPASTGPNVGRMWDITPAAGYTASNGAVSVNLVYANNLGYFMNGFVNNQPADRRMFHFGPAWVDITGVTGTFESGNYSITNYTYCRQPGVTDFSPFTITNFGAVLPIELVSFQANCKEDNSVSVAWTTASEYNTSHYVVEKSRDGINWSVLGQKAAAGNSTQLLNYEMIDIEKAPGTSYYRLTQFDNDGVFEMFDPVSVNCHGTHSNNHITTYPNPSLDGFYVSLFTETMEGNGQLTITDASGRPVYGKSVNIQDGNNVFHIGDMNAASGMYYIQVSNGTNSTDIVKHSLR
jgi:hypothetical protein